MAVEITADELELHSKSALKAAQDGPVFITDGLQAKHVLISYSHYQQLISSPGSIVDALAMPHSIPDVDFDAPAANIVVKPIDAK
ncbi:type II toxin-antitoxin system Phd/YefM family antitoxin [Pseudomonas aeruginosa]|uniref:type II toxin-antitoxin system Phd/YefM family antitoxin n=1 Tax=Pseudomonas aeruginosa TaxID=287 RepID=UPI0022EBAA17|nr:type II toxin-antitoxin system Phd/YefM family antitoxin [Pseudomonas aeruginosa]